MNNTYVVEALRWGDRNNHSYVVGVYNNINDAVEACVVEEMWRGGKYDCVINDHLKISINIQCEKENLLREGDMEKFQLEVMTRINQFQGDCDE